MNYKRKTWIEINEKAIEHNFHFFKKKINKETKLWAVVKSNAYGHGLVDFSIVADKLGVDGFCVDDVFEGLELRKVGIKKPILVLGPTTPKLFKKTIKNKLTITISNLEALDNLLKFENPPKFHLKIDTGMHRQGFYVNDLPRVIGNWKLEIGNSLRGVFTHFAAVDNLDYTKKQFNKFLEAIKILEKAGFKKITKHISATGGVVINRKYHLDAVRIGIGLYGYWPSDENQNKLTPVLSWKSIISEIKEYKKGDYFGYNLTEKASKNGRFAVIPIGYWHGLDRELSNGNGEILIKGKRAKILGRISMDLTIIDVSKIDCKMGDEATIIGKQKKEEITAEDIGQKLRTIHYEVITRINPLIERVNV